MIFSERNIRDAAILVVGLFVGAAFGITVAPREQSSGDRGQNAAALTAARQITSPKKPEAELVLEEIKAKKEAWLIKMEATACDLVGQKKFEVNGRVFEIGSGYKDDITVVEEIMVKELASIPERPDPIRVWAVRLDTPIKILYSEYGLIKEKYPPCTLEK